MKKILKNILGEIPFFPEAYWLLHGSKKPWNAHYQLSGLNTILPQAVEDVKQFGLKASNPKKVGVFATLHYCCLLYTSPSPRDRTRSRMPSSA